MNQKQIEGKNGEKIATKYLETQGYKIICTNFRCLQGEIDIIAKDNETFVFVEVKTRTSLKYGEAKEAVNETKQKHIYRAIEYYLYKNRLEDAFVRIDVIEIYIINRRNKDKSYKAGSIKYFHLQNRIKMIKYVYKKIRRVLYANTFNNNINITKCIFCRNRDSIYIIK